MKDECLVALLECLLDSLDEHRREVGVASEMVFLRHIDEFDMRSYRVLARRFVEDSNRSIGGLSEIIISNRWSRASHHKSGASKSSKHTSGTKGGVAGRLFLLEAWFVTLINNDQADVGSGLKSAERGPITTCGVVEPKSDCHIR